MTGIPANPKGLLGDSSCEFKLTAVSKLQCLFPGSVQLLTCQWRLVRDFTPLGQEGRQEGVVEGECGEGLESVLGDSLFSYLQSLCCARYVTVREGAVLSSLRDGVDRNELHRSLGI